ncbi:hypothetical protein ACWEGX_22050 [Streptomyces chartreusis]
MTSGLQFSWELSGSGWATCLIQDASSERKNIVSYCTDALAELLRGVAGLYGPIPVQRFSFDLEPAEVRWVLRGRGSDVGLAIYRFPDMSASFDASDQEGTLVWSSTQSRGLLGHVVMETARSFPIAVLQDLRRLHLQQDKCELQHGVAVS